MSFEDMASTTEQSPFASLRQEDLQKMLVSYPPLAESLRTILQDEDIIFCEEHDDQEPASESAWRLHAALLTNILHPLPRIFKRSSDVAIEALESNGSSELELVFKEQARQAYVWLQCMLAEDLEWCTSIGCPTCSVTHILSSETTLRAVLASSLLLPAFTPILPTMKAALQNDPFWTPRHYPHLLSRSHTLVSDLRCLIQQTTELQIMLSSPPSSDSSTSSNFSSNMSFSEQRERDIDRTLIGIKPSKLAKRQMRLKEQVNAVEHGMLRRFVEGERAGDTRMLKEKKGNKKAKSGGLSRNKSSGSLAQWV